MAREVFCLTAHFLVSIIYLFSNFLLLVIRIRFTYERFLLIFASFIHCKILNFIFYKLNDKIE